MKQPSWQMMAVFRAAIRRLETTDLEVLRQRFADLDEHPSGLIAIDKERSRRLRASGNGGASTMPR